MSGTMGDESNIAAPFSCSITVIQATGEAGKSFEFDTKNWCVLGSHQDCDIRIKHSLNAPLHALVLVRQEGIHLIGLHPDIPVHHSRTGASLTKEQEAPLLTGDSFYLGDRGFRVDYESPTVKCLKSPSQSVSDSIGPQTRSVKKTAAEKKVVHRTQSSERKRRSRRRVSLVVEADGERFVSQKRDTERLLSKTQIARLSDGEGLQTPLASVPEKSAPSDQKCSTKEGTQGSRPHSHEKSEDVQSRSEEDGKDVRGKNSEPDVPQREDGMLIKETDLPEQGKGGVNSALKEARSRKMSLPPTPTTRSSARMVKSVSKQGTLTARERKKLVYARLSLGLTAHPSKNEMTGGLENNVTVAFASQTSATKERKLDMNLHKSNNQIANQEIKEKNMIRSPLTDKSPILNIQRSGKTSGGVSKECRTPSTMKTCPGSLLRSSKSTTRATKRSVAFSSKIELERGKHYSPFRPSVPRTTPFPRRSEGQSNEGTPAERGRFSFDSVVGVPHDTQNSCGKNKLEVGKDQTDAVEVFSDPSSGLEGAADSDSLTDASDCVSDSSSPATGSSTDSSTSRLTGAITSLLKRFSGNGDQQKTDEIAHAACATGKVHASDSKVVKLYEGKASTEPLMSVDEIQDISSSKRMSVSRRLSFLEKVFGAAAAVRNVMADTDEDSTIQDKLNENGSNMEGAVCRSDGHAISNSPSNDVRNSSGEECEEPESESKRGTASCAGTCVEGVSQSLAQDEEQAQVDLHSSIESQPGLVSSDGQSVLCEPKQRLSLGNIFERLTKGTGEHAKSRGEVSANDHHDSPEDYGSPNRTISCETNSIDSQDTADTFERELEIRVNRASFRPHSPRHGEDVEDLEAEIQGLIAGNEVDSPLAQTPHGDIESSELDQSVRDSNADVLDGKEVLVENDEETQLEECCEDDRSDSEGSQPCTSPEVLDTSCSRSAGRRRSSQPAPESQKSVPELSEEAEALKEPNVLGGQTEQKDEEQDLEAELNQLLVVELRERLRELNLSIAGRKAELVERLTQHILQEEAELPEEPEQSTEGEVHEDIEPDEIEVCEHEVKEQESESTVIVISSDSEGEAGEGEESESNLELYRRKTVKELRQILKGRNLDIMSKLRKEELIQHMIAEGVKLPEHDQDAQSVESPSSGRVLRSTRKTRQTPSVSRRSCSTAAKGAPPTAKSLNRLTVIELRSCLREQHLCQQGTKRVLIDRILSEDQSNNQDTPANELKSNNSCKSCQAGQGCEVENRT